MAQNQDDLTPDIGAGWVLLPQSLIDMLREERFEQGWAWLDGGPKGMNAAQHEDDVPDTTPAAEVLPSTS
ncbi:hypothetical protein C8250_034925 [Streptomyces sp. So13.3]|uniref:hypothetical protein n=1 Tax=unclassified Streptomyces TaxID=2593676 RepID=UPI001105E2F1|nr:MULTISPECIES: hypothetical protein [unclassified Streptomyces]MCZ4101621.1 hypothetical protein [Streptomyces sp. H39-C1]QNA76372.1 hypothetical protein C8250_034925 [Streptomyces sp. So13.3]